MKFVIFALMPVLAFVFSSLALAASDEAFMTVNGIVLANTCTLSSELQEQTITLNNIADREIKGKGTTGGDKEVNIVLRDCGATATAVTVSTWGNEDGDDVLAFKNSIVSENGGATGVGLYFYQTDGKTRFNPNGSVTQTSELNPSSDNALIYLARYVGTKDTVIAGRFSTVVNINFEYQ